MPWDQFNERSVADEADDLAGDTLVDREAVADAVPWRWLHLLEAEGDLFLLHGRSSEDLDLDGVVHLVCRLRWGD